MHPQSGLGRRGPSAPDVAPQARRLRTGNCESSPLPHRSGTDFHPNTSIGSRNEELFNVKKLKPKKFRNSVLLLLTRNERNRQINAANSRKCHGRENREEMQVAGESRIKVVFSRRLSILALDLLKWHCHQQLSSPHNSSPHSCYLQPSIPKKIKNTDIDLNVLVYQNHETKVSRVHFNGIRTVRVSTNRTKLDTVKRLDKSLDLILRP